MFFCMFTRPGNPAINCGKLIRGYWEWQLGQLPRSLFATPSYEVCLHGECITNICSEPVLAGELTGLV